jgi:signal transduction histidine kinase
MKYRSSPLREPYQTALRQYLRLGTAASLLPAQRLGRQALALGLETLDLAQIHDSALVTAVEALPVDSITFRKRMIKRAGTFFAKAILPMEAIHRSVLEANSRLSELNLALKKRTRDLLASNRKLAREVIRRKTAQESLRKSEDNTVLLLEQSRLLQEQLRLLSRRALSAQEEERKRISRELHDVIAQMLTGINVRLATLITDAAASTKGLSLKISRAQRLVEKSVDIVHRFARELRPALLDDLGLVPAVHSFLKGFAIETGIRVNLTAFKGEEQLTAPMRTALYRVALEALTNVARHAQASRIDVTLRKLAGAILMEIKDDGKAFDVEKMWTVRKNRHLGMLGMRERMEMVGGSFTVESSPGVGTTIKVQIPFKPRQGKDSLQ